MRISPVGAIINLLIILGCIVFWAVVIYVLLTIGINLG